MGMTWGKQVKRYAPVKCEDGDDEEKTFRFFFSNERALLLKLESF